MMTTALDADRYRECMRILGLRPDATEDEIEEAYREKVKKWHPDKYATPAEKGVATKRTKQLNNARDYVLQHRSVYKRQHPGPTPTSSSSKRSDESLGDEDDEIHWTDVFPDNEVVEWLLIPIESVWAVAAVAALFPVYLYHMTFATEGPGRVGKLWLRVAPHLILFSLVVAGSQGTFGEIWFLIAFVVILLADVAAQITGWWIQRSNQSEVEAARSYLERYTEHRRLK